MMTSAHPLNASCQSLECYIDSAEWDLKPRLEAIQRLSEDPRDRGAWKKTWAYGWRRDRSESYAEPHRIRYWQAHWQGHSAGLDQGIEEWIQLDAEAWFLRWREHLPDDPEAWLFYQRQQSSANNKEKILLDGIQALPASAALHKELARHWTQHERETEAIGLLKVFLARYPEKPDAYRNLSALLQGPDALETLLAWEDAFPDDLEPKSALIDLYLDQSMLEKATATLWRASKVSDDIPAKLELCQRLLDEPILATETEGCLLTMTRRILGLSGQPPPDTFIEPGYILSTLMDQAGRPETWVAMAKIFASLPLPERVDLLHGLLPYVYDFPPQSCVALDQLVDSSFGAEQVVITDSTDAAIGLARLRIRSNCLDTLAPDSTVIAQPLWFQDALRHAKLDELQSLTRDDGLFLDEVRAELSSRLRQPDSQLDKESRDRIRYLLDQCRNGAKACLADTARVSRLGRKAVEHPENVAAWWELTESHMARQEWVEALTAIRGGMNLRPQGIATQRHYEALRLQIASEAIFSKNLELADKAARDLLEDSLTTVRGKALAHYVLGRSALLRNRDAEAIPYLQAFWLEAFRHDPVDDTPFRILLERVEGKAALQEYIKLRRKSLEEFSRHCDEEIALNRAEGNGIKRQLSLPGMISFGSSPTFDDRTRLSRQTWPSHLCPRKPGLWY